ncbi:hypothetical protein REPUB_Repub18cG0119300 [Reevesia pubescens]
MYRWSPLVRLPVAPPLPPLLRSQSGSRSKNGVLFPFGPGILSWIIVRFAGITSWISVSSAKPIKLAPPVRNALLLGGSATMRFTSIASADGSKPVKCVHWIIVSGSSKNMATRSFGPFPVESFYLSHVVEGIYTFLQPLCCFDRSLL